MSLEGCSSVGEGGFRFPTVAHRMTKPSPSLRNVRNLSRQRYTKWRTRQFRWIIATYINIHIRVYAFPLNVDSEKKMDYSPTGTDGVQRSGKVWIELMRKNRIKSYDMELWSYSIFPKLFTLLSSLIASYKCLQKL